MILLDSFYSISSHSKNDNAIMANIAINADHKIFSGHFPSNPVCPGIVQLQIIQEILGKAIEKKTQLKKLKNCKFMAIFNPIESPIVDIEIELKEHSEEKIILSGKIFNDDKVFLKITAEYQFV
jgi:3-hydroxyacyl-[acyl-carrier-protein] dehydratase